MKNSIPEPPSSLSPVAKSWWRQIANEYGITDSGGLLILQSALEAHDRMREAQQIIAKEGAIVTDRFGQQKAHPAVIVERDARGQMAALLRDLHLDLEPLRDRVGRPSGR